MLSAQRFLPHGTLIVQYNVVDLLKQAQQGFLQSSRPYSSAALLLRPKPSPRGLGPYRQAGGFSFLIPRFCQENSVAWITLVLALCGPCSASGISKLNIDNNNISYLLKF